MTSFSLIALLTDFGQRDWYVPAMKGVILTRCPQARIVDITHDIPPQDVTAGALTLAASIRWFPPGTIVVAVVDPGVGTGRALLAIRAAGRYLIGPDNGLLSLAIQGETRLAAVRLTNRHFWLPEVSQTFQGRDILAPVAAYLASGGRLKALGVPVAQIAPLPLPAALRRGRSAVGQIIHIDAFGNIITNLPAAWVPKRPVRSRIMVRYKQFEARVVSSYAADGAGELIAVAGSLGLIELAIRERFAAWELQARRGERVELELGQAVSGRVRGQPEGGRRR